MFVDYTYYTDNFNGTLLTEDEFNKFGDLACIFITTSTMSRVTDTLITSYPAELIYRIKNCACSLAEYLKEKYDVRKNILSSMDSSQSTGIVRSKKAGAVSIDYDTSTTVSYYLNTKSQQDMINMIIRQYLAPVVIGTVYYNLLSKVIDSNHNNCGCCGVI